MRKGFAAMKKYGPLLAIVLFSACSTQKTNQPSQEQVNHQNRIQKQLVDHTSPKCVGCIKGSAAHAELKEAEKKVYYLFGAEHLNLDNYYFDIPVVYNDATKKWINYFTGRGRELFRRYSERAGRYAPVMAKILDDNKMPKDLIYLAMAESGFQNHAKSWAKAVGPWQFMPYTGKRYGLRIDWFIDERRDPIKATQAAANYLKKLYNQFGSWELACASYNAGEGKIGRAIRRYGTKNFWKLRRGRYLKSETKNYVPKIMALAIIGKNLKAFGFEEVDFHKTLDFEEITVAESTDLYRVAEYLGIEFEEMKKYNPEIRRWNTPAGENYTLRVPVGKKAVWDELNLEEAQILATNYKNYSMRGRSSLHDVAKKFKLPVRVLASINDVPVDQKLNPQSIVKLPFREDHSHKHSMYSDLYERPRRSTLRRRRYRKLIRRGMQRGKKIENPSEYYTVQRGDNLWNVARKTGTSLNTLIRSNSGLLKRRQIMPGDKLAIR